MVALFLNIEQVSRKQADLNLHSFKYCMEHYSIKLKNNIVGSDKQLSEQLSEQLSDKINENKKFAICGSNLYIQSRLNDTFVIDLKTKKVIWSKDLELDKLINTIFKQDLKRHANIIIKTNTKSYKNFLTLLRSEYDGQASIDFNDHILWLNWVILNQNGKKYALVQKIYPNIIYSHFKLMFTLLLIVSAIYSIYGLLFIFVPTKYNRRIADSSRKIT
jgi:hypothetical protein